MAPKKEIAMKVAGFPILYPADEVKKHGNKTVEPPTVTTTMP